MATKISKVLFIFAVMLGIYLPINNGHLEKGNVRISSRGQNEEGQIIKMHLCSSHFTPGISPPFKDKGREHILLGISIRQEPVRYPSRPGYRRP